MSPPDYLSPEMWLRHLFSAKAAHNGGVVRRKVRDVERFVGLAAFEREIARRGYFAVVNGVDIIVFCNREPVRPLRAANSFEGIDADFSKSPPR